MTTFKKLFFLTLILVGCQSIPDISSDHPTIDLYIHDAMVIDGTGKTGTVMDVYIVSDQIVHLGYAKKDKLVIRKSIDGSGYILTPGFIDAHAHGNPVRTPGFDNFLSMGVTTIVLGQDGSSPVGLEKWYTELPATGTNIIYFTGHGSLRSSIRESDGQPLTDTQRDSLKSLLEQELTYAYGLSMGLEYVPGMFSDSLELTALAQIVGKQDKLIMSHVRNEDDDKLESSIDELIELGQYCDVHVAHMKSVYGKGTDRADEILSWVFNTNKAKFNVTADVYPYFASYTGIGIVFPSWAKTSGDFEQALKSRKSRLEIFLKNKVLQRNGPSATLLGTEPYKGKTLAELEEELNKPYEQILIDIGPNGASGAYFIMNDSLQKKLLSHPNTAISSDGSPTMNHPRGYGSFSRMIEEFVVQDSLLSLESAVYKMSGLTASILKLEKRGTIKVGNKADLLLFKPDQVKTNATYSEPYQLASGFDYVVVNGQITIENGIKQKENSGRLLLPKTIRSVMP